MLTGNDKDARIKVVISFFVSGILFAFLSIVLPKEMKLMNVYNEMASICFALSLFIFYEKQGAPGIEKLGVEMVQWVGGLICFLIPANVFVLSVEGDYDSIVVRTYKQEQSVYVYQFPEDQEFPCVRNFSCRGMTEDQEYYIFADYTDYYTHGYEPVFTHYQYLTSYAVNRETGEVLREREWSDIECEWLYNEEYKKAIK